MMLGPRVVLGREGSAAIGCSTPILARVQIAWKFFLLSVWPIREMEGAVSIAVRGILPGKSPSKNQGFRKIVSRVGRDSGISLPYYMKQFDIPTYQGWGREQS